MNRLKPYSFLLIAGDASRLDVSAETAKVNRAQLMLFHNFDEHPHFQLVERDSDVVVYMGAELHRHPRYTLNLLDTGWDYRHHNGVLVRFAAEPREVSIHSDFLGSEIVYYATLDGNFVVSNRIENMSSLMATGPDYLGVYQFLHGAFSVGGRTMWKGVYQSRPTSTVTYSVSKKQYQESFPTTWRKDPRRRAPTTEEISSKWQSILDGLPGYTLMLSAGWDSRLLMLSSQLSATYTHGDLASREVQLAFRLASRRSVPMTFQPLESTDYSVSSVLKRQATVGHAFFPHWHHAAEHVARHSKGPLTAGLNVEHFSGHYGVNSLRGGTAKLKSLATSMLAPAMVDRIGDSAAVEMLAPILSKGYSGRPWFLGTDWLEYFNEGQEALESDVSGVLQGYVSRGTTGAHEICERYRLEHSGRQYFANQTKCALPLNGYYHPYGDSELSQLVVRIPYSARINYKLSRAVVASADASLLLVPMAATLVKAKRPILVQEASRLARIGVQALSTVMAGENALRLGWNNFQFLNRTNLFHEYVDSLNNPIWDRDRMHRVVDQFTDSDKHAFSLLDMFGRIMTVDHVIT